MRRCRELLGRNAIATASSRSPRDRRHLLGDRIWDAEPLPFASALLDELVHATTSAPRDPARHRRRHASPATRTTRPRAHDDPSPRRGSTCAEARRCSRRDTSPPALALQTAEQRVDRALAHDREAAGAEPLRHLVAVRRPLLHHRQQAEVEHSAEELAAAILDSCHAAQGSISVLAPQATRGTFGEVALPGRWSPSVDQGPNDGRWSLAHRWPVLAHRVLRVNLWSRSRLP